MDANGSSATWVAVSAGAGAVVAAAMLLGRTLRPTLETRQYVNDIHQATEATQRNFSALSHLERTRELATALSRELEGRAR